MTSIPRKIELEFTDTPSGGSVFVHQVAFRLDLPLLLEKGLRLKVRNRGASDVEMMLSLIYTLANGDGAISDVDRLAFDTARREILGLRRVPGHRRLGEYPARFNSEALASFYGVARCLAGKVVKWTPKFVQCGKVKKSDKGGVQCPGKSPRGILRNSRPR